MHNLFTSLRSFPMSEFSPYIRSSPVKSAVMSLVTLRNQDEHSSENVISIGTSLVLFGSDFGMEFIFLFDVVLVAPRLLAL